MTNAFDLMLTPRRLVITLILALLAFVLTLVIRLVQGRGAEALLNAVEAMLTTFAGSWLAQATLALMINWGEGSKAAQILASTLFLIWPGLISLVGAAFDSGPAVFGTNDILWFALAVGAGAGFVDGFSRVHPWAGPGVITFFADFTWGLGLTVNALLLHLINFLWADPREEPRTGAHRYASGFRLGPRFAFTQGNVFSNLKVGPGGGLYDHEMTHVWQNRIFGPFFWTTYFGWLIVFGAIALVALAATFWRRNSSGEVLAVNGLMWWPYFNNPWELWAYSHNPTGRTGNLPAGDGRDLLDWPLPVKVILTALGMTAMIGGLCAIIWRVV